MRRLVPIRAPVDAAALEQRRRAFAHAASMCEHWHLASDEAVAASVALAMACELWVARRRLTSGRTLYAFASEVAWESSLRARINGATDPEARAIRAVVRAHVLQTSLSRRTVEQALGVGGWYAEIGMLVLERVR